MNKNSSEVLINSPKMLVKDWLYNASLEGEENELVRENALNQIYKVFGSIEIAEFYVDI